MGKFKLRGGSGNVNPYAKMADKGLINPQQSPVNKIGDGKFKEAVNRKVKNFKAGVKSRRSARTKSENLRTDLAYGSAGFVGAGIVKFVKHALSGKPISGIFADKPQ